MDFGDASHIEDLEGFNNSYPLTHFYKYPFEATINNLKKLTHNNCICVALVRGKGKTSKLDLIGYKIEYLENIDFYTYHKKLDINGFECLGLGVIENVSEQEAEIIIKDLKLNSYFYVQHTSDLN